MAAKEVNYSEITPEILELTKMCTSEAIPPELYTEHEVFRGLRDLSGNGVRAGLTRISEVHAKKRVDGKLVPDHGKLFYRGINVEDIVEGFLSEGRFGFEETVYLLLFGKLPNKSELVKFSDILNFYSSLPPKFTRDVIMKSPSRDMMNAISRSVLMLYSYDGDPDNTAAPNVLRQCLQLIAMLPRIAIYGFHAYNHYEKDKSLFIHRPDHSLSFAENILHMLRSDQKYTQLEAKILDLALVLHAEHGGGNNSSFTVHVVSSSGTDTYSAIAGALGSLKGPRHGGANIRVKQMMTDLEQNVENWRDDNQVVDYLEKVLNKEAFDKSGLIYGIGHAVYSLSDPRAVIFENFVQKLSAEKGREEEYELYAKVARLAPEIIAGERQMYKGVSANIDFYSGFVYDMLNLPVEMYTPIFAISRMAGWSAHRIEELVVGSKIIRPAYMAVEPRHEYVPLVQR